MSKGWTINTIKGVAIINPMLLKTLVTEIIYPPTRKDYYFNTQNKFCLYVPTFHTVFSTKRLRDSEFVAELFYYLDQKIPNCYIKHYHDRSLIECCDNDSDNLIFSFVSFGREIVFLCFYDASVHRLAPFMLEDLDLDW